MPGANAQSISVRHESEPVPPGKSRYYPFESSAIAAGRAVVPRGLRIYDR
jgi:hypothetical protein